MAQNSPGKLSRSFIITQCDSQLISDFGKMSCFKLVQNPEKGRILVAAQDISACQLILEEAPCALGPQVDIDKLVCLSCFIEIDGHFQCSLCSIPMCSKECALEPSHQTSECRVFQKLGLRFDDYQPVMRCIFILRLILALRNTRDPQLKMLINDLMDHNSIRKQDKSTWEHYETNVTNFMLDTLGLSKLTSREEINRLIGVMRTNGIQTKSRNGQTQLCLLYPQMAILSHSCICNARCVKKLSTLNHIEIYAQHHIPKGEEITIQYTSLMNSTRSRRQNIKQSWCFDCHCPRCCDPSELGSELGTLQCHQCNDGVGYLRLIHPLAYDSDYGCHECQLVMSQKEAIELENNLESALNDLIHLRGQKYVEALLHQAELTKRSNHFHPNHYLQMRLQSELISHLGNIPGYFYFELSDEMVRLKRDLCLHFIEVFSKVDPGFSDWRGTTQYELANTEATLAQRDFDSGQITLKEFQTQLEAIIGLNQEAARVLEVEDEESHAFEIGLRARKNVRDLKDIVRFSEFL